MLKPIKNNSEYEIALERAYDLMQQHLAPESEASDELEVLSILIKEYESVHFPIPKPHPIEAIKFRLDQMESPNPSFLKFWVPDPENQRSNLESEN